MPRKLVVIAILLIAAIGAGALTWTMSAQGLDEDLSSEAEAIRETILSARRITIEAENTFDTSKFASVYINDPRGGEIRYEALARIREIRQDPTIQMTQVGILDYKIVSIENLQREYNKFIAELRARQASGTLSGNDLRILEVDTYGWSTPAPTVQVIPTQPCTYYPELTPYPDPANLLPLCGPTPTPLPPEVWVPYRGPDPATLPPEAFEVDIFSIEIDGETAKAVVHIAPVTTEYLLVKVDGQWYIAGTNLIKAEP